MIYLGSPYWHKDPLIRGKRVDISTKWLVHHLRRWSTNRTLKPMIAPLLYTNEVKRYLGTWSNDDWIALTDDLLKGCSEMHLLELPEWKLSRGLQSELAAAASLSLPVHYIPFESIEDVLTREARTLTMLHKEWDEKNAQDQV